MRYVAALFDAPIPARAALLALNGRGFAPVDLAVLAEAELPDADELASGRVLPETRSDFDWPGDDLPAGPQAMDEVGIERALVSLGIGEEDAATFAEGVARHGAILVLVRCPTASRPVAERALISALPPSPAEHRARWASDPRSRYAWASLPPQEGARP